MLYMLDTNICIYLIKSKSKLLLDRFKQCKPGEVGISTVTLAELRFGVAKSKFLKQNTAALNAFLPPLEIASFDEQAAGVYGMVRAELEAAGTPIGPLDTMIGGHALSLGASLISNNVGELGRIKDLQVLDWSLA
ncbi:MAG: type II toxin-antitoxin system VapC family toxin [Peptococcaceae bacterium]|jgi:tRNA(fMet)-specific endonuclease VapC|nr:type II toxin-antitoxin system VapC family toxin [Peptococcaceae bacterium]